MDPYSIGQIAQLRKYRGVPTMTVSDLLRLRKEQQGAQAGQKGALEDVKRLGTEARGVTEEMQGIFADVPAYKRPEKEKLGSKDFNTALIFGAADALFGGKDPGGTVSTVLQPRQQRKDVEYQEGLETMRDRMAADERTRSGKIQGLQAKLSGIGTQMDVAGVEQSVLGNQASQLGSEIFNREGRAMDQANADRAFTYQVLQDGILNAFRRSREARDQESHDLNKRMVENPYQFMGARADFLAKEGFMGGDRDKIMQGLFSDIITGANEAELSSLNLTEAKEWAKTLPEKIAFQKWSWEQEKKESNARIGSYNRANRGSPGATIEDFRFGQTVKGIDSLSEKIRDAESALVTNDAKWLSTGPDKDLSQNRAGVTKQIGEWKLELLKMQNSANGLKQGAYDTSWAQTDPYLKRAANFAKGLTGR